MGKGQSFYNGMAVLALTPRLLAKSKSAPRVRVDALVAEYRALQKWNNNIEYTALSISEIEAIRPPREKLGYLHNGLASLVRAGRGHELPPVLRNLLNELIIVARATGNRKWLRKLRNGAERGIRLWTTEERNIYLRVLELRGFIKYRIHAILAAEGAFVGNTKNLNNWSNFHRFLKKHQFTCV